MIRKVVFTGSRNYSNWPLVHASLLNEFDEYRRYLRVAFGDAPKGLDRIVKMWVSTVFDITGFPDYQEYEANWSLYGSAAGPIRNHEMIDKEQPHAVYAFPENTSRGTLDCATYAHGQRTKIIFPEMNVFTALHGTEGWRKRGVEEPEWFSWAKKLI